ncbi:hypothetical protein RCU45_22290 [Escherichia coli]|nr:hypothetical protein [Escherichia coli]MED0091288.1 hypothetical protein [Escherichia coli]MED0555248.1 hypothetical protein [Escherichia coli]MED9028888.1 hypothetical protein [Escherichia coli]MED9074277.1 hypothetical protein [Escherichia coli]
MTERRDLQQITTHQHCRQYPLDGYLAMNICKMTARQISRIRDMSLSELRKQEYVSREEFAYITGRTFKATGNYLDRNEDLVYREYATPNAAYPKRYAKLQYYWATILNNKASITPQEQQAIRELRSQQEIYRKLTGMNLEIRGKRKNATQEATGVFA